MEEMELEIESFGSSGEGVASHDGLRVFVEGALPGERVRAAVTQRKKTYAKAIAKEWIETSPDRVKARCPIFGRCGGCQIMHASYDAQLRFKRQKVEDAMRRIGKLDVEVADCVASPHEWAYRNKIQLPVVDRNGEVELGLYARRSHDVVPVDACPIHCELGEDVFGKLSALLKQSGLTPYDERTGHGNLRFVLIRSAVGTGQALVALITSGHEPEQLARFAQALMAACPSAVGVVENVNRRRDNVIIGGEWRTLAGGDVLEEELMGLRVRVAASSFMQVNPYQVGNLYSKALELCALEESDVLLDAYCGVGTMSLLAARACKSVIGIEVVEPAILNARANAKLNGFENAEFICGLAEKEIQQHDADVVLLNPPRKGCAPEVLESVAQKGVKRVVYVSCDPATLARDMALLQGHGYVADTVYPFDMFPQTLHVESVTRLRRKSDI